MKNHAAVYAKTLQFVKSFSGFPGVLRPACSEQISAHAVDGHDQGELLEMQALYALAAEVLKGDNFAFGDTFAGKCAGAADCTEIYRPVAFYCVAYSLGAFTLADHCGESHVEQQWGVYVHSA